MDGLTSLMQGARAQQPMQQQPMQQQPMQQQPMQGMNPAMSNAIEVVNNDVENLNLDPRTEYALKIQEASDLLKAAERNLAMSQSQPTPPEVIDQRKQQVQQQIQGGIGGLLQQLTPGMQQRGMQMAAAAAPQMQGGLPTQSAPNMVNMSQGGIIGYADGGEVYDDIGAMAALHKQASDKMSDPNASIQAKANAQQDINMVRQQAGNRYGQVMRRVDEMRGLPPLEMAMGGQVKRYANGGPPEDYLRQAIRQEGITDPAVIAFLEALYAQESSSGANVQDSPSGAQGPMQVMPGTFTEMADENWDSNDPMAQTRAGVRYALQGLDAADGDAQRAGQYYYGGPNALNNADISDPNNPNFPTTGEYGNDIVQSILDNQSGPEVGAPHLRKQGGNRQDQRITALNAARLAETGESLADQIPENLQNLPDELVEWASENPVDAIATGLMFIPAVGWVGGTGLKLTAKLLSKVGPRIGRLFQGLVTKPSLRNKLGQFNKPGTRAFSLPRTLGTAGAGIMGANALLGGDDEEVAAPEEIVTEEVTAPEKVVTEEVTAPEEVVTETTGEGTPRERQFNLDNLISGLLAAGNATSTSQALRGYGVGSQAETQRQEGIAREEREARLLAQNRLNELETQYRLRSVELARELEGSMDEERFKAAQTIMGDINNRMDSNFEALVATEAKRILEDGGTGLLGRITGDDKKRAEQQARINLMRGYVLKMTGSGGTPDPDVDPDIAAANAVLDSA